MTRIGRVVAALAAAVTMVGALVTAPSPAAAPPLPPPHTTFLASGSPIAVAADDMTGRVAVLAEGGVTVHAADGSPAGGVDVTGTELVAGGGAAYVLAPAAEAVHRIDLTTRIVATWPVGRAGLAGLALSGGRVWTSGAGAGGGTGVVGLDVGTGALTSQSPTLGGEPLVLAATPGRLVAVEAAPADRAGPSSVWQYRTDGGAFTADPVGRIDQQGVIDATITYDHVGLTVRSTSHPDELREYLLGDLALHGTFASGAGTVAFASDRGQRVVVWTRQRAGRAEATVHSLWEPEHSFTLALDVSAGRRRGLALAADARWLYVASEFGSLPTLAALPLGPEVGAVDPPVVGRAGGAEVRLTGSRLAGSHVEVDGVVVEPDSVTPTSVRVTMPARPVGPSEIAVVGWLDAPSAPETVRVVDLGVHPDVASMVEVTSRGFGAPPVDAGWVDLLELRLASGEVSPGAWPVGLARRPAFAEGRGALVRLYLAMLGRFPDTAGLGFWVDRLASGSTLAHTAASFAASSEFRTRYGPLTDGAFVDRLYRNVLGRGPDAAGIDHWLAELRRGVSRGKVAQLISESAEHRARTKDRVAVVLLALGLLRRTPTNVELGTWLHMVEMNFLTLEGVAEEMMGHPDHSFA
jgi:hypothetical protein